MGSEDAREGATAFAEKRPPDAFWEREDRYEGELPIIIAADVGGKEVRKALTLGPLPHPSPLNQRWYARFPELLAARLAKVGERSGSSSSGGMSREGHNRS